MDSATLLAEDDGVRLIMGATPKAGIQNSPTTIREGDASVLVYSDFTLRFTLSPAAARHFARALNKAALRIEKRTTRASTEPSS